MENTSSNEILIRDRFRPGDIGYITYLHGALYQEEYGHGVAFEAYVAQGLAEFYQQYDPEKDRIWICEDEGSIIGSLFLMHRDQVAQLRYFLVRAEHRGRGLGNMLMQQYMDALERRGYTASYLWTTHELDAAASLYKRYGFELTEEQPSTRFGKPLREQKYEWKANE